MNQAITALKDPRRAFAVLWPLVLTVPYLPGVPRPFVGGLAWRQELAFAIVLVVTAALLLIQQRKFRKTNNVLVPALLLPATLFVFWIAASVFWSANPYSAGHYAFTWIAYLCCFSFTRMVAASPRALRASCYALGSVVWLLSISCVIEWLGGATLTDYSLRATLKPLFRGFSGFGEVMAVAMPIFGALALTIRNKRRALLCGATALISWLVILQAYQRAPIIGAAMGILLLIGGGCWLQRSQRDGLKRVGVLFIGFVVVAVAQLLVFPPTKGEAQTVLQRLQSTSTSEANTSVRLLYWGAGWEMFRAQPLHGVGANNYEVAFAAARERFAATHPDSALVGMNEQLLTQYAHNEYVQILAELGLIGALLFAAFCLVVVKTLWQAIHYSSAPLLALGAGAGLLAFAVSSAASAFSFRWFGSGLICFFAVGLISHLAESRKARQPERRLAFAPRWYRPATATAFAFALLMFFGAGTQATNSVLQGMAQASTSPARAENLYRYALRCNPFDAASHFNYGSLLYQQKRYPEAVSQLSYAVNHGFNTSTSYAALAAAQEQAGQLREAESTLASAARTYPNSVFILVRHAAALSRLGRTREAEQQFAVAVARDARAARGWYQLINFDIDAALTASQKDTSLAKPGELEPQTAVYIVLKENERRLNISPHSGWRGRVASAAN